MSASIGDRTCTRAELLCKWSAGLDRLSELIDEEQS
jgi:hypothetical protein